LFARSCSVSISLRHKLHMNEKSVQIMKQNQSEEVKQ